MKSIKIVTITSILGMLFMTQTSNAQRRVVVKKPHRTVVRTTSPRVVYKRPTPVVRAVRTLPATAVVIKRNGVRYHYYNGRYYRYNRGRYVIVTAPRGVRIKVLPVGYRRIVIAGKPYFYFQGVYYVSVNNGYKVVEAPDNIIVYELPEEAEQVEIDGKTFYEYDAKLYKVVTTPDGKGFKVVGDLEE